MNDPYTQTFATVAVRDGQETKVVGVGDLNACSMEGWRPILFFEETLVEKPVPHYNGSTGTSTYVEPIYHRYVKVLVSRSAGTAIAEATRLRQESDALAMSESERAKRLEADLRASRVREEDITANMLRYKEYFEAESAKKREAQDRAQKMEDDLGKIRQAVGAITFKQILEGAIKP